MRSVLGLVRFYKSFLPQASKLSAPLSDIMKKTMHKPRQRSEYLQERFNKIKYVLASEPALRLPDSSLSFVVHIDASSRGLEAVLLQCHLSCPHPVSNASRKLLTRESKYLTIEREYLDVVYNILRLD